MGLDLSGEAQGGHEELAKLLTDAGFGDKTNISKQTQTVSHEDEADDRRPTSDGPGTEA